MASSTRAIDDQFAANGVAPSGRPSASRPVSAERRMQNRKAQKSYRDRRRARLRELEDKVARLDGVYPSQSDQPDGYSLLSATGNLVPLLGNPSPASSTRDWQPTGLNPSIMPDSDGDLALVGLTTWLDPARPGGHSIQTPPNTTQFADSFFPGQLPIANVHQESMLENPNSVTGIQSEKPRSQRDILIFRPGGKTVSAQPRQLRQRILALPQAARDELRDWAKNGNFSFVDTFHYLVEDGDGHGSPLTHLHQHPGATASYSPYRNVLHMARISYFAAIFANFSSLGFDFALFLDENSKSPFHGGLLDGGTVEADVPPSLRPISSQLSVPHHPYIDSLPFPTFRRRILAALSTDPPLLDEDDLCIDLMVRDGLVCWGSCDQGGMDRGTPWDSYSWQAKGWFLRKWWWLIGGKDGELWSSSRWWASQRGEQITSADWESTSS
ncbi:hypothetical protein BKA56DRAFT_248726 [Ilyonectria sp. MPI-CAGE-AT-0026]|nr:hypothetical protein BKA56DRAFT_248726 [Ilyonectria sp. MPI-CAGE-AT-0026]